MFHLFAAPGETSLFTINVNHGGQFEEVGNGNLQYVNGHVEYFDQCDVDYISMMELEDFVERLRYEENVTLHYRVSAINVRVLEDDMDVMALMSIAGRSTVVEILL